MDTDISMQSWLDHLRRLSPPTGVVHVGAGNGTAARRYADWGVTTALFIEAEEELHDKLNAAIAGRSNWSAHMALVSAKEGTSDYYRASNPNENGVLVPESLSGLWRNLKTCDQCQLETTTLESLLSASSVPTEFLAWAVIDCLPALPVIRGAGRYADNWDVIIARVILDEKHAPGRGASKEEVDSYLSSRGYCSVAFEDERQPAVGIALYVRDWKAGNHEQLTARQQQLEQLTKERDEQVTLAAAKQTQLEQAGKAREEQSKLAAERQQQLEQLTRAKEEQAKLIAEKQAQLEQLAKAKEEQAKLAAERQQQLEQLTRAKDEQTKLAAEKQAQLDQLSKAKDEQARLAAERQQQLEQLKKERDGQVTLLAEKQTQLERKDVRLAELKNSMIETEARQQLMNEEMLKAEGQIELIKDILLKESRL